MLQNVFSCYCINIRLIFTASGSLKEQEGKKVNRFRAMMRNKINPSED